MRTATCTLSAFLCEDITKAFDAQMVLRALAVSVRGIVDLQVVLRLLAYD